MHPARISRASSSGSNKAGRNISNPRFNGCWCCGSTEQTRAKCPEFLAVKAKNGGKVPKAYAGAYERSKKAGPTSKVAALTTEELEETIKIWPALQTPPPIPTSNSFSGLFELGDGESDDESDVIKALRQLTSNVQLSSEKSMSQKARKAQGTRMNVAQLNAIAKQVKEGNISFP